MSARKGLISPDEDDMDCTGLDRFIAKDLKFWRSRPYDVDLAIGEQGN